MRRPGSSWGRTPTRGASACALALFAAFWPGAPAAGAPVKDRWSKSQLVAGGLGAKPDLQFEVGPGRYGVLHWWGKFAKNRKKPRGPLTGVREPGERHFSRLQRVIPNRASWASWLAMGSNGDTVIAWQDPRDGRIKATSRTPDEDWGDPVPLSDPLPWFILPLAAVGPDGGAIVVWGIPLGGPPGDHRQRIEAALRPPGGAFGPPVVVAEDAFQYLYGPHPAIGRDLNGVLVVHRECDPADPARQIPADAWMIVDGTFVPPTAIPNSECPTMRPAVAADDQGGAIALFPGKDVGAITWPIRVGVRSPGEEEFMSATKLNADHPGSGARLAMGGGGEAIVGWRRDGRRRNRIMASIGADDGTFSPSRQLSRGRLLDDVAVNRRGDAVAAIQAGESRRVQAVYRPVGGGFLRPELIAQVRRPLPINLRSVAVNPQGKAFVAWGDVKGRGDNKRAQLYLAERRVKN